MPLLVLGIFSNFLYLWLKDDSLQVVVGKRKTKWEGTWICNFSQDQLLIQENRGTTFALAAYSLLLFLILCTILKATVHLVIIKYWLCAPCCRIHLWACPAPCTPHPHEWPSVCSLLLWACFFLVTFTGLWNFSGFHSISPSLSYFTQHNTLHVAADGIISFFLMAA